MRLNKKVTATAVALLAVVGIGTFAFHKNFVGGVEVSADNYTEPRFDKLPYLEDGNYYEYGDVTKPYYEVKDGTIQIKGVSWECYLDYAKALNNFNTVDEESETAFENYYADLTALKYYVVNDNNLVGKSIYISPDSDVDRIFSGGDFGGSYPSLLEGGGFTGDILGVRTPCYLVKDSASPGDSGTAKRSFNAFAVRFSNPELNENGKIELPLAESKYKVSPTGSPIEQTAEVDPPADLEVAQSDTDEVVVTSDTEVVLSE